MVNESSNQIDNQRLQEIISSIITEAEEKIYSIKEKLSERTKQYEKETLKMVEDLKKRELEKESYRVDFVKKRTQAEYEQKAQKIILETKEEIVNEVWTKITKKLELFRKEKTYTDYLQKSLLSATQFMHRSEYKLIIDKRDKKILEELIKEIRKKENLQIDIVEETLQTRGGFIITDNSKRIKLDYTLEHLLMEKKEKIRNKIIVSLFK